MEYLYIVLDIFSSSLDSREELVHGNLSVILIELREESGFQVNLRIDGAAWKASNKSKATPLRVPMNDLTMTISLSITLLVCE